MANFIDWISQPWPWYVSGFVIALVMLALLLEGKKFGMSSNMETLCAMGGAGKISDYFEFDWKKQVWNLTVVVGAMIGGYVAANYLTPDASISLNPKTIATLSEMGFEDAGQQYLPPSLFQTEALFDTKNLILLLLGGLLVGFGARYSGGCTSGHAITGLSNLQLPSLIAVVGFFIGGLLMNHFILPLLF